LLYNKRVLYTIGGVGVPEGGTGIIRHGTAGLQYKKHAAYIGTL